jgi:hypothetical protein
MTDAQLSRLLMDLLGSLTDASKKITEVMMAMAGPAAAAAPAPVAAPEPTPAEPSVAEKVTRALDRIQEFEPGPKAQEEKPRKRAKRGKLTITADALKKAYVDENRTAKSIAEEHGVSPATINLRLREWKISKRGAGKGKRGKK